MNHTPPSTRHKDPIKITGLTRVGRILRRQWSSIEWAVTWLGLPRQRETSTQPGLILLQIDGLSLAMLETALARQEMPFLKSLMAGVEYRLGPCYSGLPSNWAAAQAELLYGVPTAVPGSRYYDRMAGKVVHVVQPAAAQACEERLAADQVGLLQGGSSYCNLLGGGASDVHFCGTSAGWSDSFRSLHPLMILSTAVLHLGMWVRGGIQVCRELADFFFSLDPRTDLSWWARLAEIPARVVATVFLRELSTLGACYDAARGTRIIQVNFLGYDEQAHRFGPDSPRTWRQLRAIDRSVRRIWRAAHLGSGREYDVWVFSTHGQESTLGSNLQLFAKLQAAVAELSSRLMLNQGDATADPVRVETRLTSTVSSPRSSWFGWTKWWGGKHREEGEGDSGPPMGEPDVLMVPSGTVTQVYLLTPRAQAMREELAYELSKTPFAPLVCEKCAASSTIATEGVQVWSDGQVRRLPHHAVQVFGTTHPHLSYLANDLKHVVLHPDAGDLVICGWSGIGETINYLGQAGGHNGPGVEETTGFALLPSDVQATLGMEVAPRPADLRQAALRVLDSLPLVRQADHVEVKASESQSESPSRKRILTYNIHGCVGMDGELSPQRIARVVGQSQADIVCLQEIDRRRPRSQNVDQVQLIADALGMQSVFAAAWEEGEKAFGNAIITSLPIDVIKSGMLPRQKAKRNGRSAIWVEVTIPSRVKEGGGERAEDPLRLQVINTHLSIYPSEQLLQAKELVRDWLEPAKSRGPVVLCGDFNAAPGSATWKVLAGSLRDVEQGRAGRPHPTYFSPYPLLRVDHIFVSPAIQPQSQVVRSRLAKIASDHLPVLAELGLG